MSIFKAWPKIKRDNPFNVTITEKIDGTNSCVIIENNELVGVQSRNRLITPEDDNYGFSQWVEDNKEEILTLGDGYHYGEWAGPGIQKNPHDLAEKEFFLFNTFRWNKSNQNKHSCCSVVPVLFQGELKENTIEDLLLQLQKNANEKQTPEGIIVYYHAFRTYTKHTIKNKQGKWKHE